MPQGAGSASGGRLQPVRGPMGEGDRAADQALPPGVCCLSGCHRVETGATQVPGRRYTRC